MSLRHNIQSTFQRMFGIDLRSLAAFRIGISLVLLADIVTRCEDLKIFYSDEGIMRRFELLESRANRYLWSLNFISGSLEFQVLLFAAFFVCACLLLVGYRTRLMNFLCWIFLCSVQTRFPLVLQGGDILFRVLLFWSLFLPLGAKCSVDSHFAPESSRKASSICNAWTAAILLQVVMVYFFSALLKDHPRWHTDGTAIFYALHLDVFATRFGVWLRDYPNFLKGLTFFTYYLELYGWGLAFIPFCFGFFRTLAVFVFIGFHLGIGLSLDLGIFPFVDIVGWLPFLPTVFWQWFFPAEGADEFEVVQYSTPALISNFMAILLIAYCLLWNLRSLKTEVLPKSLDWIGYTLRLDQRWDMFSPYPIMSEAWLLAEGELANGVKTNLFAPGEPLTETKPELLSATFKNHRWRKYLLNLYLAVHKEERRYLAKYFCRSWNSEHSGAEELNRIQLWAMEEKTLETAQQSELKKVLLWRWFCKGR